MLVKFFLNLFLCILLVSCSSLVESTRKSLLGKDSPRKSAKKEVKWVSKAQYDDLMSKYKNLNNKYESLKENKLTSGAKIDQINNIPANADTVDVFGSNGIVAKKSAPKRPSKKLIVNETKVDEDLTYFKKAVVLKENGKVDESLKIFQFLENSRSRQIQVRSKRYIGDIYFQKSQYDLALQVYEEIIRSNAFSGGVLMALNKAAKCAQALGLADKQAKYESLLKDIFEVQV